MLSVPLDHSVAVSLARRRPCPYYHPYSLWHLHHDHIYFWDQHLGDVSNNVATILHEETSVGGLHPVQHILFCPFFTVMTPRNCGHLCVLECSFLCRTVARFAICATGVAASPSLAAMAARTSPRCARFVEGACVRGELFPRFSEGVVSVSVIA